MDKITPEKAIHTLRTADPSSLFFYSQHIAEVLTELNDRVQILHELLRALDDFSTSEMGEPLSTITMYAKVDNTLLHKLLLEISNAQKNY